MLTVSKALSAGQAQSYHQLEYTSETQSYYKQGGAVEGEWQGKLAEKFGLTGVVSAADFARLTEGQHPETGEQLVKHRVSHEYTNGDGTTTKSVEHRAGWDATFSTPKSVSLTALVGGDERVREAHRVAVTTALNELERYTQARIGGNAVPEKTGHFIVAKFEHDTARPVDGYAAPQLHTHAVIFNMTQRTDGSMRALQEKSFFDSQNLATAVYQSSLMHQLRNLGYEIEPGKSGAPEIRGYSQAYLEASSPRSQQIREYMERTGHAGAGAAQIAAHATRDAKEILSPKEVLEAHRQLAAAFGNEADRVIAEARQRAIGQERSPDGQAQARQAMNYARAKIFEREAVADERVILRDALRRGMGETTYAQVRAEFDSRQRNGELREVSSLKYGSGRRFTTPETIAIEKKNIATMVEGKNAVEPMMTGRQAKGLSETRAYLNSAQQNVIQEVLTTRDRVHGIQGLAGTGKTTTLEAIREGAEHSSYAVEGFAPTSRAAAQLREAGISATTLQSFVHRGGTEQTAGDPSMRHLYMLDESSLASARQMRDFLLKVGPQDRILVIGDTRQHQGVEAGRPFEQLQDAGMRTSQLDQIVRQKDPELLKAVQHLARNEVEGGIKLLGEQGRITELPNAKERTEAIAKDYAAHPESALVISPDNASRQAINDAIRAELRATGQLAQDGHEFQTLSHRSDMTGADRQWAVKYEAGNVLQYTTGSKAYGVARGASATVLSVRPENNTLTVQLAGGQNVSYDPRRLQGVNVYSETLREFATGDRVQFTAPNKELGVANRELGTITNLAPESITLKMDGKDGRSITFDPSQVRQIDHGYTVTSHSSQGLTANRVIANIDTEMTRNLINSRLAYVSISRATEDARIYTNDAETLAEKLSTDISKSVAIDFKQLQHKEPYQQDRNATLRAALEPSEAAQFEWNAETGTIQTYEHTETGRNIHIDAKTGQFYDQARTPITKESAMQYATTVRQEIEQSIELGL